MYVTGNRAKFEYMHRVVKWGMYWASALGYVVYMTAMVAATGANVGVWACVCIKVTVGTCIVVGCVD